MKTAIIWALTIIMTVDSVFRMRRTSVNLGSFLMYTITFALWCYAIFGTVIDRFLQTVPGTIIKIVAIIGCSIVALIIMFIFFAGFLKQTDKEVNVVIVLGAGIKNSQVTNILAYRLNSAVEAYEKNNDITIVVTGGMGHGEDVAEAVVMKQYLIDKGVPQEKIIQEDKSESTQENFLFAKKLLEDAGIDTSLPISFATNHFHCYRASLFAKDAGFTEVYAMPSKTGLFLVPQSYLREAFAVMFYWVFRP